jgi:hypothetical protein
MSYTLQAIVGSCRSLSNAGSEHFVTIALTDILAMVPLRAEVRKRYNIPFLPLTDDGVEVLPQSLDLLCRKLSRHGLIAYLEAEFFGGSGEQAHVLFKDGVALGSPVIAEDAINQALRHFGILPDGHHDEFAALGLGRFRDTDDWTSGPNP